VPEEVCNHCHSLTFLGSCAVYYLIVLPDEDYVPAGVASRPDDGGVFADEHPALDFSTTMSFLELKGLHVFVTGAAGGIGSAIVEEFLGRWQSPSLQLRLPN
jgi:hypothetical protein